MPTLELLGARRPVQSADDAGDHALAGQLRDGGAEEKGVAEMPRATLACGLRHDGAVSESGHGPWIDDRLGGDDEEWAHAAK